MTERIAVGTPVTVKNMYGNHGNDDLVVLAHSSNPDGVGVGPKGNDPALGHSFSRGWVFYPNSYVTPKEESKAVTKFKVGDKVRFNDKGNTAWYGVEGIVESIKARTYGTSSNNKVRLTKGATGWASSYKAGDIATLGDYKLELVEEKPFTFKDIQKGDTIRRTQTFPKGAKEVREGTVSRMGNWYAEDNGYILAYDSDDKPEVTLELLNRPEPEPVKEDWETAKPGDKLIVKSKEGITRILTKQPEGDWDCLLIRASGNHGKGIRRDDESVKIQLTNAAFNNGKAQFIKA